MYRFEDHKEWTKSESGISATMEALIKAQRLHATAGAFSESNLTSSLGISDSWNQLAIVDRLVELGYLARIDSNDWRPGFYRYTR